MVTNLNLGSRCADRLVGGPRKDPALELVAALFGKSNGSGSAGRAFIGPVVPWRSPPIPVHAVESDLFEAIGVTEDVPA